MSEPNNKNLEATPEQVLYASVLNKGMLIGLLILFITFIVYVFGILDPYIPLADLDKYWTMNVDDYLRTADIQAGWSWTGMLGYGDFLNFIGVAILAGVTIFCYLAIVPTLLKNNDKIYVVLALAEAVVLALAAAGILAGGH